MKKFTINGFGQIGQRVLHAALARGGYECLGINDLALKDPKVCAGLFRAMSKRQVSVDGAAIVVDGARIPITAHANPQDANWGSLGSGLVVVESTGVFRTREKCMAHINSGAAKVLLTVPPDDEVDAMIVLGCNDEDLQPGHQIISNASCTTNSIAMPVRRLHEQFGILAGTLTTVHSATNDQVVCDRWHSDPRRARSSLANLIPTTTGAARAIGKVYKPLAGRLNGGSVRVGTATGSLSILNLVLRDQVDASAINAFLNDTVAKEQPHIFTSLNDPLDAAVLTDIIDRPESSLFDPGQTLAFQGGLQSGCIAQVAFWYDNVAGYSNRCVDLIGLLAP